MLVSSKDVAFYSHFSYHRDRRRTELAMSIHQNPHCVPWQQSRIQTLEGLAILHPKLDEAKEMSPDREHELKFA
jgi:hypothetical protein